MLDATQPIQDDIIQPFQIESQNFRGRYIRLGHAIDTVIRQHKYPDIVGQLLGKALALAASMADAIKFDGVFTLQTRGNGPISMMVVDVTSNGDMRGYAQFDEKAIEEAVKSAPPGLAISIPRLMGSGYLAFTVMSDQSVVSYQGIVELQGASLEECIHHYFRQSEQIQTAFKLACDKVESDGQTTWRATGIMLQRIADNEKQIDKLKVEDDWHKVLALLGTSTDKELLDSKLSARDILYRLFHEDGVRVYDTLPLRAQCRCSRARLANVISTLSRKEIEELKENNEIVATCEFCNRKYVFDDETLEALHREARGKDPYISQETLDKITKITPS